MRSLGAGSFHARSFSVESQSTGGRYYILYQSCGSLGSGLLEVDLDEASEFGSRELEISMSQEQLGATVMGSRAGCMR